MVNNHSCHNDFEFMTGLSGIYNESSSSSHPSNPMLIWLLFVTFTGFPQAKSIEELARKVTSHLVNHLHSPPSSSSYLCPWWAHILPCRLIMPHTPATDTPTSAQEQPPRALLPYASHLRIFCSAAATYLPASLLASYLGLLITHDPCLYSNREYGITITKRCRITSCSTTTLLSNGKLQSQWSLTEDCLYQEYKLNNSDQDDE